MIKVLGIIPARFASTRFPGKPLVDINGKPMIQRVYEQAKKSSYLKDVYVATDDSRIYETVINFGGQAVYTSEQHPSGTDRCYEAARKICDDGIDFNIVVNIQGDEPYIQPDQINLLCSCFDQEDVEIATLVRKIDNEEDLFNPSVNKVVFDNNFYAIYFSRQAIPYMQDENRSEWVKKCSYYKHIGIYAYRFETLKTITLLEQTTLEKAESLEQLRWIENGFKIRVEITENESFSVDTPEDLSKFSNLS